MADIQLQLVALLGKRSYRPLAKRGVVRIFVRIFGVAFLIMRNRGHARSKTRALLYIIGDWPCTRPITHNRGLAVHAPYYT